MFAVFPNLVSSSIRYGELKLQRNCEIEAKVETIEIMEVIEFTEIRSSRNHI